MRPRTNALSNPTNAFPRARAKLLRPLGYVRRFLLNPRIRWENLTRLLYPESHIQGATFSELHRYPELFAACADLLGQLPSPKILSFGCATGEEPTSLAENLPHATIIGADINHWCLKQSRNSNQNPRIRFLHTGSTQFAALADFDAIFCMAVFQRSQNRTNTAPTAHGSFKFARFEQSIARLDAKLKPGGLFFIDHADFRFEDTAVARNYTPLEFEGSTYAHDRPLFGPDNRLIALQYTMQRAFQKRSAPPA